MWARPSRFFILLTLARGRPADPAGSALCSVRGERERGEGECAREGRKESPTPARGRVWTVQTRHERELLVDDPPHQRPAWLAWAAARRARVPAGPRWGGRPRAAPDARAQANRGRACFFFGRRHSLSLSASFLRSPAGPGGGGRGQAPGAGGRGQHFFLRFCVERRTREGAAKQQSQTVPVSLSLPRSLLPLVALLRGPDCRGPLPSPRASPRPADTRVRTRTRHTRGVIPAPQWGRAGRSSRQPTTGAVVRRTRKDAPPRPPRPPARPGPAVPRPAGRWRGRPGPDRRQTVSAPP